MIKIEEKEGLTHIFADMRKDYFVSNCRTNEDSSFVMSFIGIEKDGVTVSSEILIKPMDGVCNTRLHMMVETIEEIESLIDSLRGMRRHMISLGAPIGEPLKSTLVYGELP